MDSDALLEFLEHAQQGHYVTVAALCLVLHDHFFTCRQEWRFIWIRKWSFSKILFFLSRYGTLGILLLDFYVDIQGGSSDNFCNAWFCFQSWSGLYSAVIIEAVLIFRIYAMYHGKKKIMYPLAGLFICQLAAMAYVLQAGCRTLTAASQPFPGVETCVATSTISYSWAYWAALLLFETLLFALSMRKAYEHIRQYTFRLEELIISRRVGEVLIRDGVMYFPFIFLSYLVNLVLFAVSPQYFAQVAPHIALALRSVLTNRLLLNVSRKFYYPNPGQAQGNDGDRDGVLTGRDSVIGFIVWASPARHGPSRSQLGVDIFTSASDVANLGTGGAGRDGVERRGEGGMRLVAGRGLRTMAELREEEEDHLKDEDERLGVGLPGVTVLEEGRLGCKEDIEERREGEGEERLAVRGGWTREGSAAPSTEGRDVGDPLGVAL